MKSYKHNLQTKNINDFKTTDTIYIRDLKHFNKPPLLCEFIKFERNRVHGKVIATDESYKGQTADIGEQISARLADCALYGESPTNNNTHFFWFQVDGFALRPEVLDQMKEAMKSEHPSFGVIEISAPSGGTAISLFGSSIKHHNTIRLSIKTAELNRDLSYDRYFSSKNIVEVEMSPSQFAEMITSSGKAGGTPCTIRYLYGSRIEDAPYESKRAQFQDEFRTRMKNLETELKSKFTGIKTVLAKPSIGKADREFIQKQFDALCQEIASNVPFMSSQFQKQMDETTKEAKGEIEAFFEGKIRSLGLEAFQGQIKGLLGVGIED